VIVVTGADGFVGTALAAQLRLTGRGFRGLVRAFKADSAAAPEHQAVGDLTTISDETLGSALAGADVIVHLAGRAHVMRKRLLDPARAYHEANVVATERLAHAASRAGVRRIVFVSSIKVNGETTSPGRPFRADNPPRPHDHYAKSKRDAEQMLTDIARASGMSLAILRPPLMYGPRVRGNFLTLWRAIARGVPLPLGRIDNRRHLLYVGNLVHAIVALIDGAASEGTWLIADRESVSTPELARRIAAALRQRARLVPLPVGLLKFAATAAGQRALVPRLTGSLEVDASPLAARIGPLPYSLDEGLADTAAWWASR
jgi:nucleoside-diphosphate-sugar epimerase